MSFRRYSIRSFLFAAVMVSGMPSPTPANAEEVYMIRGFLNVFSNGVNEMARQLNAKGIKARAISNGDWRNISQDIIARNKRGKVSYPIIIAGHSLGGVEAASFANALGGAGVKVSLVIGLDPGFASPKPLGPGIVQVVNYKIPSGKNYRAGRGFKGKITTIDVSKFGADHVGIDKNKKVQRLVIARISARVR